ncbi:hypothetical protein FA15DRAFT_357971 [Coprinopsis marcescibilis]|uniref:F-box domain-containing protein n=1 Tax=Coprinopsis marcescibilis TaxID=230819 RepID=A0A5C3LAZ1_COPMA|nr:hypothetical protein FA15DRAFT_357971 [Coprinopsis marcescibilis]
MAGLHTLSITVSSPEGRFLGVPREWRRGTTALAHADSFGLITNMSSFALGLHTFTYRDPVSKELAAEVGSLERLTKLDLTPTCHVDYTDFIGIKRLESLREVRICALLLSHKPTGQKRMRVLETIPVIPNLLRLEIVAPSDGDMYYLYDLFASQTTMTHVQLTYSTQWIYTFPFYVLSAVLGVNRSIQHFDVKNLADPSLGPSDPELKILNATLRTHWSEVKQQELLSHITHRLRNHSLAELVMDDLPVFSGRMIQKCRDKCLRADCSKLETFRFVVGRKYRAPDDERYLATFADLQRLAISGCRSLKHLELQFNELDLPMNASRLARIPDKDVLRSDHGLETLGIVMDGEYKALSFQQMVAVALYLDRLFPVLEMVWGISRKVWEDVDTLVKSYQKRRNDVGL